LGASLEFIYEKYGNKKAKVIADAMDKATEMILENKKWPSRKVNELDNRGEHFYFALYLTKALAEQNEDKDLKGAFADAAKELAEKEDKINKELLSAQGAPVDIDGYYYPDKEKMSNVMRPSETFNAIIDKL